MSGQKTQAEVVAEMRALRSAWAEAVKSAPWQDVEALLQAGNALDGFVARFLAAAPEAEQIARDAERYRALGSHSGEVLAIHWVWTEGQHKGATFWGCHSVTGDGRIDAWPGIGLKPLGAAKVRVVDGEGLDLVRAPLGTPPAAEGASP